MQPSIRARRSRESVVVVQRTGPRTLDGIVAAAAAVAISDGAEQADELRSLLQFLRNNGLMGVLGRGKTLARFQNEINAAKHDPSDISTRMRHVVGMQGARLVAAAALSVAVADGIIVPEEHAVLRRLHACLGLSPDHPALA